MRAAVITAPGGPEVFAIQEIDDPSVGPEEVLVAVRATALNRADLLQRRGRYPGPPGTRDDVPGLEMAGEVVEVGANVRQWKPGDRVMALLGGGGYADRIAVHERMLMPIPSNLSFTEAASIPEVFLTAFDALFMQCGLQPGENVLVHAVGSGVGSAAVQLASAVGCRVFGTAGSEDKLARAKELGLEIGVNYHAADFAEAVNEHTKGRGVDVILDVIGAAYWPLNISAMAQRARMIIVGTLGGAKIEVDLGALMAKRASVQGTLLRARALEEKATLTQAFVKRFVPMFESGRLVPVVDRVYPLTEVADAHTYMETNANFGKIVLEHEVR